MADRLPNTPDDPRVEPLRDLAIKVAIALQRQPEWDEDALEVRDTFDAFLDSALGAEADAETLKEWLA